MPARSFTLASYPGQVQPYLFHLQCTDSWDSVLKRFLPTCEPQYDIWNCNPAKAVTVSICWLSSTSLYMKIWRSVLIYLFLQIFHGSILFYWEPQFHPLIREVIMNIQVLLCSFFFACVMFVFRCCKLINLPNF
jgi:hypothetical protein